VQKHDARNIHYDFRLELDGVLKSWAIPKGPSLDPAQKRLAIQVEDHQVSYAEFEGVIPPDQYGAGTVIIWDGGTWEPIGEPREGLSVGKLEFRLHGEKLQGAWALVRMHGKSGDRQESWLLIKERDNYARAENEFNVFESL
jgi:ATP-dependent DNA ligase LigD phosphoesterase module/ATP-dependent DNA ligase LigD polymerase module